MMAENLLKKAFKEAAKQDIEELEKDVADSYGSPFPTPEEIEEIRKQLEV